MKIALLTPGGVDRSGVERVIPCILWLIERLVAAGDEVHVFAFSQESRPGQWPLLGATVHNVGYRPRTLRMLPVLVAEHRKARFDVVHALWADPSGLVGAVAAKLLRVPHVLTLAGGDLTSLPAIGYGGRLSRSGRLRFRIATAGANIVTAPSEALCRQARALGIDAIRVPLGVALDRWPARPPRRRDTTVPVRLLHIANLNRVKDQETLLQACARLYADGIRFELDVIGVDTLDGHVQQRTIALGLGKNVHFRGFMPHHAMRSWVERSDILLVSSQHEAGPLVTLEAAVMGVPTVGTAVGHIADFAPHAAVAVPVGDSTALAGGIRRLAGNEEERLSIAAAAQKLALGEDADLTVNQFRQLYMDVVRRNPTRRSPT